MLSILFFITIILRSFSSSPLYERGRLQVQGLGPSLLFQNCRKSKPTFFSTETLCNMIARNPPHWLLFWKRQSSLMGMADAICNFCQMGFNGKTSFFLSYILRGVSNLFVGWQHHFFLLRLFVFRRHQWLKTKRRISSKNNFLVNERTGMYI